MYCSGDNLFWKAQRGLMSETFYEKTLKPPRSLISGPICGAQLWSKFVHKDKKSVCYKNLPTTKINIFYSFVL